MHDSRHRASPKSKLPNLTIAHRSAEAATEVTAKEIVKLSPLKILPGVHDIYMLAYPTVSKRTEDLEPITELGVLKTEVEEGI